MSGVKQQRLGINDDGAIASVEQYEFEPIRGYPMLQWHGKRPFRLTHYYPAQLKEVHGEDVDGWRNRIYWGDNLQVMSHLLKEYRGQVALVYLDPPFDSKADYRKQIKLRGLRLENDQGVFEEKQYSDIWTNDEYLQYMYERLILVRELISENGSLYLHCDPNKGHYLKLILDEVFGSDSFKAEIAWKKTTKTTSFTNYGSEHDTLLFYAKNASSYVFNQAYKPIKESELNTKYIYLETPEGEIVKLSKDQRMGRNMPAGRRLRGVPLLNMNPNRPNLKYDFMGHTQVWATSKDRMDELLKNGLIFQIDGGLPQKKGYLDENEGAKVNDIWDDISPLNSQAIERTDYPTQKPEALIKRAIEVSSNPGDLVFDCFMGSGTTQAVAMKLGRRFIGADINSGAVQITTKRLLQAAKGLAIRNHGAQNLHQAVIAYDDPVISDDLDDEDSEVAASPEPTVYSEVAASPEPTVYYVGLEVYNVNYYDIFRNPVQAKELLLQALEVQLLAAGNVFDGSRDGRMVKVMPVNRIATRADLNDLLANIDHKAMDRLYQENPNRAVEKITLICMGHEPDLAAYLKQELHPFKVDVEVVDVLRDRQDLQFKRDSEARVKAQGGTLVIEAFYPMNLLQKLSMQKEAVEDWRELVESVMIDWNYDGAILTPALMDIPERDELVSGTYKVPDDAGTIRVKITDLLSESWEGTVTYG